MLKTTRTRSAHPFRRRLLAVALGLALAGKAKSKERYAKRQMEWKHCDPNNYVTELQTGILEPDLAQAEEDWFRAGGGPGILKNKIHAQSAKNYKGKVPYP